MIYKFVSLVIATALLVACGSGGGSPTTTPPSENPDFPNGFWLYTHSSDVDDLDDDGSWQSMIHIDDATGSIYGRINYGTYFSDDEVDCSEDFSTPNAYNPIDGRFSYPATDSSPAVSGYINISMGGEDGTDMTISSVHDSGYSIKEYYYFAGYNMSDPYVNKFYTTDQSGIPCDDDYIAPR